MRFASRIRSYLQPTTHPEVNRLRLECADAYRVISILADHMKAIDHPDVLDALENLALAVKGKPRMHRHLMPWPKEPLPDIAYHRALTFVVSAMAIEGRNPEQVYARKVQALAAHMLNRMQGQKRLEHREAAE